MKTAKQLETDQFFLNGYISGNKVLIDIETWKESDWYQ